MSADTCILCNVIFYSGAHHTSHSVSKFDLGGASSLATTLALIGRLTSPQGLLRRSLSLLDFSDHPPADQPFARYRGEVNKKSECVTRMDACQCTHSAILPNQATLLSLLAVHVCVRERIKKNTTCTLHTISTAGYLYRVLQGGYKNTTLVNGCEGAKTPIIAVGSRHTHFSQKAINSK
jgi:hypothetical protein